MSSNPVTATNVIEQVLNGGVRFGISRKIANNMSNTPNILRLFFQDDFTMIALVFYRIL
jgi:predicted amino acid-binding ACT domain protein